MSESAKSQLDEYAVRTDNVITYEIGTFKSDIDWSDKQTQTKVVDTSTRCGIVLNDENNGLKLNVDTDVITTYTDKYTLSIFNQLTDAGEYYGVFQGSIGYCCRGKQKTAGKLPDGTPLQWTYYEDFLKLPIEEQNEILSRNKGSSNDGSFLNCTER